MNFNPNPIPSEFFLLTFTNEIFKKMSEKRILILFLGKNLKNMKFCSL